jgi:hypothetical protein
MATYAARLRDVTKGDRYAEIDSSGNIVINNAGTVSNDILGTSAVATENIASGAVTSAKIDSGVLQVATVEVTSAELLAINATPKTLVAAQGAGTIIEFVSATLFLDYGTAAYANNGILGVYETNASGTVVSDTIALADFLAKTADTYVAVQALSADTGLNDNVPLVLTQATGESITGDSPVTVKITYRVHDFS